MQKNLLELEAAIVSGCNGETPPQKNIGGYSSISVINILNDRISFLENELSLNGTRIDYLFTNPRTVQIVVKVLIFMKV